MKGTLIRIDAEGNKTYFRVENEIGPTVEDLKKAVGGSFANCQCLYEGVKRTAWVDENGNSKGLRVNPIAARLVQEAYPKGCETNLILGNFVIFVPDEVSSQVARQREFARMAAARDRGLKRPRGLDLGEDA